jgi:Kef-type K+ transport system membrane component KefB
VPAAVLNESQVEGKKAGSSTEASSILGAAVIDDILGLIVLTIFLQIIDTGSISALAIGLTIVKAVAFLVAAVLVGERLTAFFTKIFSKLGSHSGMRLVLSLAMMVALYKVAELVGLAGIIGAYAAGVLLDEVHYASFDHPDYVRHIVSTLPAGVHTVDAVKVSKHHLENILEEWGSLIVIPFFVLTIFKLDLSVLLSVRAIVFVLIAAIFAFLGKLTCGLVAGKVKNKLAVGIGMVTRTEVALIIVQQATASGRLAPLMTAVIVGVIVITMVLVPIFLKMSFKRGLTFAAA